jgi:hypothetical protein
VVDQSKNEKHVCRDVEQNTRKPERGCTMLTPNPDNKRKEEKL